MHSTVPGRIEEVTSWKSLARYLTSQGVYEPTANSFVRLARDSYVEDGRFVFESQHPSPTRTRLRTMLNKRVILTVHRPESDDLFEDENRFAWTPATNLGRKMYNKILELQEKDLARISYELSRNQ